MVGKVLCITEQDLKNNKGAIGWNYVDAHRDEMESFDLEESSIDLGIPGEPRFVVNKKPYSFYKQYFEKDSSGIVNRIMVIKEAKDTF